MPELPEMETYRQLLSERITGMPIDRVEVTRERTVNVPVEVFANRVQGQRFIRINRRGKHLIFQLQNGENMLLHLMLGGWMFIGNPAIDGQPKQSAQVTLTLADGSRLYFLGLRLGYLHLLRAQDVVAALGKLGPEPLDTSCTEELLARIIAGKRSALKAALVDQHLIAGIGNCYSDEICFEAGVLPTLRCREVSDAAVHSLYGAMHTVLPRATRLGGYMDQPLFPGDARTGGYNHHLLVYDRGGDPCRRCGSPVIQTELGKRKVFYCAHCQS